VYLDLIRKYLKTLSYALLSITNPSVNELSDLPFKTGSAHTGLVPFWLSSPSLERLHNPTKVKETSTLQAKQVSKRGGELIVKFDEKNRRVELIGYAREMMKGDLSL